MYEFVSDQVLGIGGLINLSNVVFLVAYSVRDVLKLRILAVVGEGLTLPYYYFQNEKLWPPIFWGWRSWSSTWSASWRQLWSGDQ